MAKFTNPFNNFLLSHHAGSANFRTITRRVLLNRQVGYGGRGCLKTPAGDLWVATDPRRGEINNSLGNDVQEKSNFERCQK